MHRVWQVRWSILSNCFSHRTVQSIHSNVVNDDYITISHQRAMSGVPEHYNSEDELFTRAQLSIVEHKCQHQSNVDCQRVNRQVFSGYLFLNKLTVSSHWLILWGQEYQQQEMIWCEFVLQEWRMSLSKSWECMCCSYGKCW